MASLEQRANDVRVVWRENGEKHYERFPTLKQAEKFQLLVEAHGNRWPRGWTKGQGFAEQKSDSPTFAEWAARALASRSKANDRTRHDYLRDVELHLAPQFGAVPIDLITREMVGQWLIAISGTRSPKTVANIHGTASSIMADAIEAQLVTYNPFRGAVGHLPTSKHEEMVFLSRGEFDILAGQVLEGYRLLVRTLALTGLRWSEATALRVCDVDILSRRVHVVRAWKRTPESYLVIGEPKTNRSRRTLSIPPSLASELAPLGAGRPDDDLMFLSPTGRAVHHGNFRNRAWLPAIQAMQRCDTHRSASAPCGCPGTVTKTPRIHDLRHSHASWLIAARVPLPAIQRRLGHESITTTIDRYGHLAPEMDAEISAALEGATTALEPI